MTTVEVKRTITEQIFIPNCFCGEAPEVRTERAQGDNRYKQHVWIECPYYHAQSTRRAFDLDSINSRYDATVKIANEWYSLIVKERG